MNKISVILVSVLFILSAPLHAGSHNTQQKQYKMTMKHANPLPNLMKVVKKFGGQLNLDAQQQSNLARWRDQNGSIVKSLVKEVMVAEKKLHDAAFSNASQHDLQDLMDKVLSLRLQVAKRKIRCRENMKKVLNEQQWNKVVSLYQNNILAQMQ